MTLHIQKSEHIGVAAEKYRWVNVKITVKKEDKT